MLRRDPAASFASKLRKQRDLVLEKGLSGAELDRAQERFELEFPPLWRSVLSRVHPVPHPGDTRRWLPDWRLRDEVGTAYLIANPLEGVLFDVENDDFWWNAWGDMPDSMAERLRIARAELETVPRLTPLWGTLRVWNTDESPVLSISQTDIALMDATLTERISGRASLAPTVYPVGDIPFWSLLHAWSQMGGERFGHLAVDKSSRAEDW